MLTVEVLQRALDVTIVAFAMWITGMSLIRYYFKVRSGDFRKQLEESAKEELD